MTSFNKRTPSVFVVCSPFQALCAVAAIRQLEIEEYKMIALLPRGDVRNNQVESVLNHFKIEYTSISPSNAIESYYYKYKPLLRVVNKYKRLFLGDFRTTFLYYIGCGYVSDNADIVYLDDGNITISQLRGRDTEPLNEKTLKLFERYSKRRGFVFFKNLFTIYSDIPNSNYNIKGLQLNNIIKGDNLLSISANIYIVGTNLKRYCAPLGISEDKFIRCLDGLMRDLQKQYPQDQVIYIPHGAETKTYAEELCKKYGIRFLKPTMMIELELVSFLNGPKAIYGFTSTALFTLKKIFPQASIFNIVFEMDKNNPFVIDLLDCSDYYSQNGIECINVK